MCISNVIIIRSSFTTESKVHDCIITVSDIYCTCRTNSCTLLVYIHVYTCTFVLWSFHVHTQYVYIHNVHILCTFRVLQLVCKGCQTSLIYNGLYEYIVTCMNTLLHVYSVTDYNVVTRTRYYVLAHELECIYMFLNER